MKQDGNLSKVMRQRLAANDESAWQEFFAEFDPLITAVVAWPKWRFAIDLRDDLAQIIRREIVKALPRFEGKSNLKTFVKRICVHRCIDEIRRQVRERDVIVHVQPNDSGDNPKTLEARAGREYDPVSTIMKMERAAGLRHALAGMDETCRAAITDFYIRDLSYREMAQAHGITVNTVGSRLAKCLQKLRTSLAHDPEFDASSCGDPTV